MKSVTTNMSSKVSSEEGGISSRSVMMFGCLETRQCDEIRDETV